MTRIAAEDYVVRAHGRNEWVKVGDRVSVLWTSDPTKAGLFTKEAATRLALLYDGVAETTEGNAMDTRAMFGGLLASVGASCIHAYRLTDAQAALATSHGVDGFIAKAIFYGARQLRSEMERRDAGWWHPNSSMDAVIDRQANLRHWEKDIQHTRDVLAGFLAQTSLVMDDVMAVTQSPSDSP